MLYPSRLPVVRKTSLGDDDRETLLETARYWRHTTPEGVPAIAAEYYAIMTLLEEFSGSSAPEKVCEGDATI